MPTQHEQVFVADVQQLRQILVGRQDDAAMSGRARLQQRAAAIVQRWFADPVNPTLMRGY